MERGVRHRPWIRITGELILVVGFEVEQAGRRRPRSAAVR